MAYTPSRSPSRRAHNADATDIQRYARNPIDEGQLEATKALGQAMLALGDRATQTDSKLTRLEAKCEHMKRILMVAMMASSTRVQPNQDLDAPMSRPTSRSASRHGSRPSSRPTSRVNSRSNTPEPPERRSKTKVIGTGTLAKSSTSDFQDLMGAINPEEDEAKMTV
eukprot:m.172911 g.172911  ORF g.172911 m.172911 type:complete len:167 (-) comp13609_c0_seq1:182-682(-)